MDQIKETIVNLKIKYRGDFKTEREIQALMKYVERNFDEIAPLIRNHYYQKEIIKKNKEREEER